MATNYSETFKRKEVKYRLSRSQYDALMSHISTNIKLDEFGKTQVNSLYFDDACRSSISRSLEKPLYKEKLRFRWYSTSACTQQRNPPHTIFIELKKKFKGIVYKRRVGLNAGQALQFMLGAPCAELLESDRTCDPFSFDGFQPLNAMQIAAEIDGYRARREECMPSAFITCKRSAYLSKDDPFLRITFDENLQGVDIFDSPSPFSLIDPAERILEIKCCGSYPLWLARALSEVEAYPTSFSKYGELYKSGACATSAGCASYDSKKAQQDRAFDIAITMINEGGLSWIQCLPQSLEQQNPLLQELRA